MSASRRDCGVKRQVQRLSKDEEIAVTTYKGICSHPTDILPNKAHIANMSHRSSKADDFSLMLCCASLLDTLNTSHAIRQRSAN